MGEDKSLEKTMIEVLASQRSILEKISEMWEATKEIPRLQEKLENALRSVGEIPSIEKRVTNLESGYKLAEQEYKNAFKGLEAKINSLELEDKAIKESFSTLDKRDKVSKSGVFDKILWLGFSWGILEILKNSADKFLK